MSDLKYYLAGNKTDDYGNGITELIETLPGRAQQYCWHKEIETGDIKTLMKYFPLVPFEEEDLRNADQRYYGNSEY